MKISEELRERLKNPLGEIVTVDQIARLTNKRIIAVGDVTVLELLKKNIMPYLSVFDFRSMRKELELEKIKTLIDYFPHRKKIKNHPGELSAYLIKNARKFLEEGGAIEIEGEEDLTALAFFEHMKEGDILLYGQPERGIVMVVSNPFAAEAHFQRSR